MTEYVIWDLCKKLLGKFNFDSYCLSMNPTSHETQSNNIFIFLENCS